ncbi:AcrR family transcriptional regulator [Rhizomicrobium palustre]|jgi:AcrR family transcriptional regulator|uniref:AcrR family transcriptional regulator n=1 Tax=Rhizomicrobium palustre TaxID=189966 RepID=A0A846N2W0_9PROT|nr:TetR/AcrR family transcriptional regulator [Rhizomicrobium palustre]NIK89457.1 AcrR family transcriptional regulator [Rhizomicrobium palustre]
MDEKPAPISRRNRPAKAPLSREAIVTAALAILEAEGVSGISLRRVASAVDTGPASLYVYFENLNALYAAMLDAAFGAVELPEEGKGWRTRLKALLTSYLLLLYEKKGLAQLAMMQITCGPNALRIVERVLALLMEGGVQETRAALAVDLLLLHVTAVAAEHSNWRDNGSDFTKAKEVFENLSAEEYPLLHANRELLFATSPKSRFLWALDVIIDGVLAAPPPDD